MVRRKRVRKNSKYWLKALRVFLCSEILGKAKVVSGGLEIIRRRQKPLWLVDQIEAQALIKELDGLIANLAEVRMSLIAGLPPKRWAGVGAGESASWDTPTR